MAKVQITFNDKNQASFEIETDNDNQLITAIMGLESYICAKLGLPSEELRAVIDEVKRDFKVKS